MPSGSCFWAAFWAFWGRLQRSQERKNADSDMRNPLFENCLFRFLELLLALLGSSWRLLGRSWAQSGPQNGPKSDPKLVPKLVQKRILLLLDFRPILGSILGSRTGVWAGLVFEGFLGWLGTAIVDNTGASGQPSGCSLSPVMRSR